MMKKWIVESFDKIKQYKLVFCFSVLSFIIAICCILVIGTDIFCISSLPLKDKSNILRNILLGLGALIAVPFLVWQNTTSHKALHETKENNKNTQEAKMYIDCITQLANEKETIRTAAIHGLHELIKNTKDESLKEKIFNILWSFMVEHSKKCIKINDEIENFVVKTEEDNKIKEDLQKKLQAKQENIEKFYSQFKIILEILATYKDKTHEQTWWKDKFMRKIWLHKIDLAYAVLENAHLTYAKLQSANLHFAKLQKANLEGANLQGSHLNLIELQDSNLTHTQLQGAYLDFAKLQEASLYCTNLQGAKLWLAELQGIKLFKVNFQSTDFQGADLQGISLKDIDLRNAVLQYAKLQGSDLSLAKLQGSDLRFIVHDTETNFQNAKYNSKPWTDPDTKIIYEPTQFPKNFDPKAREMIDVSEGKS